MRTFMSFVTIGVSLMLLQGCGALMHPRAGEYLIQAKGPTGLATLSNLLIQMEKSAAAARSGQDVDANLSVLHDQQHAFKKGLCGVTEAEAKTPAFAKLVTLSQELRPIMHRLMHHAREAAVRELHLDLYLKRIGELKDALSAVKA